MARLRPTLLVTGLLALHCGDADVELRDVGVLDASEVPYTVARMDWSYRSFAVDVDLTLATTIATSTSTDAPPPPCNTQAWLVVDKVTAFSDTYHLANSDCSELRASQGGDVILFEEPTHHDWRNEKLAVDTDTEVISLGPVVVTSTAGVSTSYRFEIAAPPCQSGDCDCGQLTRYAGTDMVSFSLGQICD